MNPQPASRRLFLLVLLAADGCRRLRFQHRRIFGFRPGLVDGVQDADYARKRLPDFIPGSR